MSNAVVNQLPPCTSKMDISKDIDTSSLKDQSVLVTGGASGIGRAFAEALAEAGAYVTIFDVTEQSGKEVEEGLVAKGYHIQFIQGDVRVWNDQLKAFEAAISFSPFKSLDIVLPIAGVGGGSVMHWLKEANLSDGELKRPDPSCIDINLTGVWYTTHLAMYYFQQSLKSETRSAASKQLVFLASLAGYLRTSYVSDYAATKWGVRGIWRSIRDEPNFLPSDAGVKFRTSLIAPWFIKTQMTEPIQELLVQLGTTLATTDDCVDGMFRIVCDEGIEGRAVAICPNGGNFDLCDDFDGHDAAIQLMEKWQNGSMGGTFEGMTKFFQTMAGA